MSSQADDVAQPQQVLSISQVSEDPLPRWLAWRPLSLPNLDATRHHLEPVVITSNPRQRGTRAVWRPGDTGDIGDKRIRTFDQKLHLKPHNAAGLWPRQSGGTRCVISMKELGSSESKRYITNPPVEVAEVQDMYDSTEKVWLKAEKSWKTEGGYSLRRFRVKGGVTFGNVSRVVEEVLKANDSAMSKVKASAENLMVRIAVLDSVASESPYVRLAADTLDAADAEKVKRLDWLEPDESLPGPGWQIVGLK